MKLTPELVARFPRPGMSVPGRIQYAPDGRSISYLFSQRGDLFRDLWRMDLDSGEKARWLAPPGEGVTDANASREEALRRERLRLREGGITEFAWAEEANVLVVPVRGDLFRWAGDVFARVGAGGLDVKVSADGRRTFFTRGGEVRTLDERGERSVTSGSKEGLTNGVAEYIAQEELGRSSGYWVSNDGRLVAFAQVDERHVPRYPIVHQATDTVEVEEHRYPFAGAANAVVRLGIAALDGGPPRWLDLGEPEDVYLARVDWHPDGRLFVQLLSRDQRHLELQAYDPTTLRGTVILVEESPRWINLHHDLRFIASTGEFIWASERTGFKHLYLHDRAGTLVRPLTGGDWPVDAVRGVDERGRRVYFTAGKASVVERHVYGVSLDGGQPDQLTTQPGMHEAVFAPDGSSFVDIHDSRSQPPGCTVRRADGAPLHVLHPPAQVELDLPAPELHRFQTADGVPLHAAVYRPPGSGPAPVIVAAYGGPLVQMVTDSWAMTVDLRAQILAAHGFVVLKVDNRGSARRGTAFEGAIAGHLGDLEVKDQVEGVRWLAARGVVDLGGCGIYGWSYGGYLSAMALLKAPDVFTVAVAGAPVTSWDGYDTAYTERYLGTPQANPQGYRSSSLLHRAPRLRGKLLLIHGLIDENVHFRHTARLMDALIKAGKPHDVLLYPNERHMPRSEKDRTAMELSILDFFQRHLSRGSVA